ncbi:helix-turn-helix domain-containing protein [Ottowia testudinis]|uniref:Helix-turn-helix domain-containing protein n=1 Tax=Ottowia testudinis TaxID=2816950 RepID=A0A975CML1_9BURK|nr:helix-turn-helix domain-containing protein [Ottowia testudinis]QTD46258.1 helix-turn-helix domain-containing protein [Ottowia testudinis]
MSRTEHARLHFPDAMLGAGIVMAVERDTRGVALRAADRFNYYPASPFPVVSWIFEGELRMVVDPHGASAPALGPALPRVTFSGPHRLPAASWSPGPVHALSVSFFPEFLGKLWGLRHTAFLNQTLALAAVAPPAVDDACQRMLNNAGAQAFQQLQELLLQARAEMGHAEFNGPSVMAWLKSLAVRAALSQPGAGMRQVQRAMKNWTGQSHRELKLYARTEEVLARIAQWPPDARPAWAGLASETGFSDQSHLVREVRRITGVAPNRLYQMMREDEAFWLYRLLRNHHRA